MKKLLYCLGIILLLSSTLSTTVEQVILGNQSYKVYAEESSEDAFEEEVYDSLIDNLGEEYFIEDISTEYVSQEFIEDLEYNSQENIYFGYTGSELENEFGKNGYVFTYDNKKNTTKVVKFQEYDDTYDKILKNLATGTGLILITVTLSVATGGSAPAISVILATSAKSAAISAVSEAGISALIAGISEGVKTGDVSKSLKAAELQASEGFKWGAISGWVAGGATSVKLLRDSTKKGLTWNQAARLQRESKYPVSIIKNIRSKEEAKIYSDAGLVSKKINGKTALVQKIDLKYKSVLDGKTVTNKERMLQGRAPLDSTGKAYELHHIGQEKDSPLAILTNKQHKLDGNNKILHETNKTGVHNVEEGISKSQWKKQREEFWKSFVKEMD